MLVKFILLNKQAANLIKLLLNYQFFAFVPKRVLQKEKMIC